MMRKLLWLALCIVGWFWLVRSGYDTLVVEEGRELCRVLITWFDAAQTDFRLHEKEQVKKKHARRWD